MSERQFIVSENSKFGQTAWDKILGTETNPDNVNPEGLEHICDTYWYPLYTFARRNGQSYHDAQDMIQGFFELFISKNYMNNISRDKGKFRNYLMASFKHYMVNVWRKGKAKKRGGHVQHLSISQEYDDKPYQLDPAHDMSPDKIHDRNWIMNILDSVMLELEEEYRSAGMDKIYETLKDNILQKGHIPCLDKQAEILDTSPSAVRAAIYRLRKRYRLILRKKVSSTLVNQDCIDEQLNDLLKVL